MDRRSNIAAEARAKLVYERLINFCDGPGSKDALQFLMTREITHMKIFMLALDSLGKTPLSVGLIPPTPGLVDQYFSTSTEEGDEDAQNFVGPWNEEPTFERVDGPAFAPELMKLDGEEQPSKPRRKAPRKVPARVDKAAE